MNANSISLQRLKNLFRYEWAMDKRFYLLGTIGVFMISFGIFLTIWFNNIEGFVWGTMDYSSIFFSGFVFLSVFGISQSFIDLREKNTAIRYLTLPGSTMEKFLVQVVLRMIFPWVLYHIVFWLGANFSVDVYYFIQQSLLGKTALPEIYKLELLSLFRLTGTIDIGYWILIGLIASLPVLMFMGGIVFGKWSFIAMPIAIILFAGLMFGSYYALSWLIYPAISSSGSVVGIPIGNPEVFDGVPLFILVCLILIWFAVFLPFVITYLKLKEREV
ncbi:hypothetical protein [Algoriphagus chordae]|uniref:ABC-2 type transport system permease protein n=1 Tax=Algoriphagus chordae TaxID=237019 RepID=A0A2W7R647_9BACT|nr:hypothetical protein [Algoriphagus chordae]PZX51307.1 hypothetical protein LV85_02251 [Algoriphagus chordae]